MLVFFFVFTPFQRLYLAGNIKWRLSATSATYLIFRELYNAVGSFTQGVASNMLRGSKISKEDPKMDPIFFKTETSVGFGPFVYFFPHIAPPQTYSEPHSVELPTALESSRNTNDIVLRAEIIISSSPRDTTAEKV